MKRTIPRAAILAALTSAGLMGGAGAAQAAVTVTYNDFSMNASSDAASDTFIAKNGSDSSRTAIQAPGQALTDPDGADSQCTASGDTVECSNVFSLSLSGGDGDDTITEERTGNSFFFSAAIIDGGAGNDTLTGGPGRNRFLPGPGADRVRGGSLPTDPAVEPYKSLLADGGQPSDFQIEFAEDFVRYDLTSAGVTVSLDDAANDGAAGEGDDIGSDIESVSGTNANDALTAGANGVRFSGMLGDDTISGGPGNDSLDGGGSFSANNGDGAGSDTLNGGGGDDFLRDDDNSAFAAPGPGDPVPTPAGTDRLNGGDGDDLLSADAGPDDLVGGAGRDSAAFSRRSTAPNPFPADFRSVPLGFTITLDDQANDGATGAGEGDNVRSDVETVTTSNGDDVITGSAAANGLFTAGGKDTVTGGPGVDEVDTGDGDDTIQIQDNTTDRANGGRGNDSAVVDLPGGQPERADVLFNIENVTGTPFPTVVDVRNVPPPVLPVPPNVAPTLGVTGLNVKTKAFLKKGTFKLRVTVNEPSRVVADLLGTARFRAVGDLVVGVGRLPVGTGVRSMTVSVGKKNLTTFKRKLRTKAQRKKGLTLRVRVVATDAGGLPTTALKKVTIKG